jgi:hypothetical protein
MNRITRVEVIDENGRSYVNWEDDNNVSWQFQDDGKTLKVFVNKVKPKTGEEGALEALEKFQVFVNKTEMTEITLKLTFEELKALDKYVELNDETRPLFDKIKNAYPKPETLYDVIRNLGYSVDMCDEIVDAVEEFEKSKEKEMIKRNLKTSLTQKPYGTKLY